MVYERPPSADATMIEVTPAGLTPEEAIAERAMPEADVPMEEGADDATPVEEATLVEDATPVEEATPVEDDSREQPAANAVDCLLYTSPSPRD